MRRVLAAAAAFALAAMLMWIKRSSEPMAPAAPITKNGDRSTHTGVTLQPAGMTGSLAPIGATGIHAFRAFSDDFVDSNPDAVTEHMQREGLTRAETKELTYFALLVHESHDWDAVEALTSHPMEPEARRQAWSQMQRRSGQMREELQALVKSDASEEDRWEAIDRIESGYLADYYRLTGMTPALLDQLLRLSVENQSAAETAAALAPSAPSTRPVGADGNCVQRDPEHPDAAPVPVPCPM